MLPVIKAVITADTQQAEAGFNRVEKGMADVGRAASRATAQTQTLGMEMGRAGRSSGALRAAIQNASFQIGDFAVMVGGGVDASRALATQLPQLLGPFGALGAVMSAVVAVGIPLAAAFNQNAESADTLRNALGTVYPMVQALGEAFRAAGEMAIQFAEVVVNNLDRIIITAATVAGFFAAKWVAAFVAARIATFSLSAALVTLRAAIIRTGFGALIVGAGELVYQFTRLVQATGSWGEALGLIKDVFAEVWDRIKILARAGIDYLTGQFYRMQASFLNAISNMAVSASDFFAALGEGMAGIPGMETLSGGFMSLSGNILRAGAAVNRSAWGAQNQSDAAMGAASEGLATAQSPLSSVQKIRDLLASIKKDRITLPDLLGTGGGEGDGEGGSGGKGGEKTGSEKLDEELTAQERRIAEHFDRIRALTQGGLSDKLGAWGSYFTNLAQLTGSNNAKLLGIAKSFAAAQALIDAWQAHNAVLADPDLPWWARIASAGQVLAAGIGAVSAIKSVTASGGGAATSAGAAGGAARASAPAQSVTQVSEIRFMGSLGADGASLVRLINDEYKRGNYVRAVVG